MSFPLNLLDKKMNSIEEACQELKDGGWGRHDYGYLYMYVRTFVQHPGLIIEIGTNLGEGACIIGNAIRHTGSHLITIDPVFITGNILVDDDNYPPGHNITNNMVNISQIIAEQKLDGYITVIPDTSENVLKRWDGRLIDLVYVDGEHTYKGVRADCEWGQYVKPGGLVVFDDWYGGVVQAAQEYFTTQEGWEQAFPHSPMTFRKK